MKKLFTLFIAITLFTTAKAQWVTIPDANFVTWLNNNGYSGAMMGNQMDTTNIFVITDSIINCYSSNISNLNGIRYFKSLKQLDCHYNSLTSLPALPSTLQSLHCYGNFLSNISTLPSSLTAIFCYWNQLTSLPTLPTSLQMLHCLGNQLVSLPSLPPNLTFLDCSTNQLSSLPSLPPTLSSLSCDYNSITSLPNLPSTLNSLSCVHNLITNIPTLPFSLQYLDCKINQLHCLPDLKNVDPTYFNCTGNPIYCLPNYGINNQLYNSFHSQYPICSIFYNTNNCPLNWNIIGTVYLDKNSSCTYDAADTVLKNIKVELWRKGNLEQQTFSRPDGSFGFDVNVYDTFQIKIDTTHLSFYLSCPTQQTLTSIISALDSTDANMNFGMQCKFISDDISSQNILNPRHRPGRIVVINFQAGLKRVYGYECSNANLSGKVKLFKSGAMKFLNNNSYSITPSLITTDSLIWNVADFNSFTNIISFNAQVDTQAQIGQSVCYQLIVEHNFVDANHKNDTLNVCFPIRNGFDPNEKSGRLNVVDSTITYTVQFQNTGNDTAQHIIVRDTLSNDLDVASLEVLNYSFQPFTQTFGNVAVFNFPNINLVDSTTNEKKSHGFVSFKIKIKPNYPLASILNQAAIYFDFNPPIYTNISSVNLCSYYKTFYSYNQTICSNQFYSFNHHQLYKTGVYLDTLQNHFGCDSFITLNLIVNPISNYAYSQTICSNHPYLFNHHPLSQSGTYYDTLQNYVGCDSIITLNLNVKPISNFSFSQTICSNQFYSFNNHQLNQSGIYFDTLQNYVGCDSFITLHLIVNPISNYSFTQNICIGSSYHFNGNNLTTAGIYYDTLQNYMGCDSFITLHLNVNQPTSKTINQTICSNQTYNLNGTILNQNGTYYDTIQNHVGCDSFITLHLVVKPISSYSYNQTICSNQPVFIHHVYVNTSGIYHDTLINYLGCDSLITLHLTVKPATNSSFTKTICSNNPFLFNGNLLTQSGNYKDTLMNYVGCDSVITLRLTALPSYLYNSTTLTICEGSKYYYNGHVYTTNTQLYDTFTTQLGCDSIVGIKIIAIPAPDTSVVQSNNLLIAQAQHSSFYWYDCTQKQLIQNANDDTFTVYHSGSYAVLIKDSLTLCSDTSNCRTVIVSGVEAFASNNSGLIIYPNPTKQSIVISHSSSVVNAIEVTDVLGRVCSIPPYQRGSGGLELNTENLPSGIYFIKATDIKGNMYNAKFVKE